MHLLTSHPRRELRSESSTPLFHSLINNQLFTKPYQVCHLTLSHIYLFISNTSNATLVKDFNMLYFIKNLYCLPTLRFVLIIFQLKILLWLLTYGIR